MKRTILSLLFACTVSTGAMAADMKAENDWEKGAKDAWIDGKAEVAKIENIGFADIQKHIPASAELVGAIAKRVDRDE